MTRWWNKFLAREITPNGSKRVKCTLCIDHKGWSGTGNFYKAANVHFEKFHEEIKNAIEACSQADLTNITNTLQPNYVHQHNFNLENVNGEIVNNKTYNNLVGNPLFDLDFQDVNNNNPRFVAFSRLVDSNRAILAKNIVFAKVCRIIFIASK